MLNEIQKQELREFLLDGISKGISFDELLFLFCLEYRINQNIEIEKEAVSFWEENGLCA